MVFTADVLSTLLRWPRT